jgi:uncharacterized membrane protein YdfJ with MMPL/SSD domain
MTHNFINPEVQKEFDSQMSDFGADAYSVISQAEELANVIYPFVKKRSKDLRETRDDAEANKIVIAAIMEDISTNRDSIALISKKESIIDGIITARDLIRLAIISHSISEMLKSEM